MASRAQRDRQIQSAYREVARGTYRSRTEIENELLRALRRRGIDDIKPEVLAFWAESIESSAPRAFFRLGRSVARGLREMASDMRRGAVPKWLNPPSSAIMIDDLSDVKRYQGLAVIDASTEAVLKRISDEAPRIDDARTRTHMFLAALRISPVGGVIVYAGKIPIGHLSARDAAAVQEVLAAHKAGAIISTSALLTVSTGGVGPEYELRLRLARPDVDS